MSDINKILIEFFSGLGADLIGFGDITQLPSGHRRDMSVGISVAVKYPKTVIAKIIDMPTQEYFAYYTALNKQLDDIVNKGAQKIIEMGYRAIAQTRKISQYGGDLTVLLPHKTAATRAAVGWIGKCALLITKEFGSAVRLSSILTDAPLETAIPYDEGKCGECLICKEACPAGAVKGKNWKLGIMRDEILDAQLCMQKASQRAASIGVDATICGRCIAVCPYTKKYLSETP
ncbi:MAG: epoxyqueuosine reductase [Elusimicrobiota bacterium]|jgi:epoxyqueuosine reductase QueG|nr:epoxyqueuosine reductase [Elusimicrobiota bacterium]